MQTVQEITIQIDRAEKRLKHLRLKLNALSDGPSEMQIAVLRVMELGVWTTEGVSVELGPGVKGRYPSRLRARPHIVTLRDRGLIEFAGHHGTHRLYRITRAGTAALEAAERKA